MKKLLTLLLFSITVNIYAQKYVDTSFLIKTDFDISYGVANDFAGNNRNLTMDVSTPLNDTAAPCGRPLIIFIHGGAWYTGDKKQGISPLMRADFAKRGYVTASVNYRLGMFNTNQFVNCNIANWNCFNISDTFEYFRANQRAVQDVNGAIRYLINNANAYGIDPNNVFIVGESAGGFVAMASAFTDDVSEDYQSLRMQVSDAPVPNSLYESNCIQYYGLDTSISSMKFKRPDLGNYTGNLNPSSVVYKVQAAGNIFGGVFSNILVSHTSESPALYMFHQPCDLLVPYRYDKVLSGYTACHMAAPSNCGNIINRPYAYGSAGIRELIDTLKKNSKICPEYLADFTNNNYNCFQQAVTSCHAFDNYGLRTRNMAVFFAAQVEKCSTSGLEKVMYSKPLVYPNPASSFFTISAGGTKLQGIRIYDMQGKAVYTSLKESFSYTIHTKEWPAGIYYASVNIGEQISCVKFVLMD